MPMLDDVTSALTRVIDPLTGRDVIGAGLVSAVTLRDGKAGFMLTVAPGERERGEMLQAACERMVREIPGIEAVSVVVTAHSAEPSAPTRVKAPWNREPVAGVARILAVASGKGGVGKSTTSVQLALALRAAGARVGLLDADIYGPSLPRMLGLAGRSQPEIRDRKMQPFYVRDVPCMSMGFLMPDEAAVLRGPMVSKALSQLLRATNWGVLDILLADMPPGTGDVALSLAQSAPLSGAVIVTTPQEVAVMDARKCAIMFQKLNVPILGIIENMSWFEDANGGRQMLFGSGGGERLGREFSAPLLGQIPLIPALGAAMDAGVPDAKMAETYYGHIVRRLLE